MKRSVEKLGLAALRRIDPELAHGLALKALHTPFAALPGPVTSPRLTTRIAGLTLNNPVGLAAGFDKNATAIRPLVRAGFGFIEVGAATPLPQPGNAKPRLFRLTEDRAAINRFGFNNDGAEAIVRRLARAHRTIPVGLNLGANKDSANRAEDARVSAIIATNTTLDRINLRSRHGTETGGLSGAPLFEKSTRTLAKLHTLTDIPLIGVGGISTARDAYAKIRAGASAVQLYTGLVYGGLSLAARIAQGLDVLLQQDGFGSVSEAVGTNTKDWL